MAAEANAMVQGDLIPQTVDFTTRFNSSIKTLLKMLGKTAITNLPVGSEIKIYKSEVTKKDGTVGEGELIPLSSVTKKYDHSEYLSFGKWRKQASAELIQSSGFKVAVNEADGKLLREIQNEKKQQLFDQLAKGSGKATGVGLQAAIANALGKLTLVFEDIDVQTVLFVNPTDVYDYLGKASVTVQSIFGMQYIQNFLGYGTAILSGGVPAGTFYATVADNINIYKAPVSGGELGKAFNLITDQTGLIGMTHQAVPSILSYETIILSALAIFPERLDGIFVGTIEKPTVSEAADTGK